jgi:hypothetical protein
MARKAGTIVKAIGVDQSTVMATPTVTTTNGKKTVSTAMATEMTIIMETVTITVTNFCGPLIIQNRT